MSSRVIRVADGEELSCGEDSCMRRAACEFHAVSSHVTPEGDGGPTGFKPSMELVIAGGNGTLTCHNYEKGESDGGTRGR